MKQKKCNSVFTDNDFNSSDGMLIGLGTEYVALFTYHKL